CSLLDCVIASAAAGEVYYIVWSGNPLVTVALSGMRWLACFFAGPVLFAGTAVWYWLECGDPGILDWLILGELGIVAVAYHLFALLALTERGRVRDLNPLAVADLAHRLGWRTLAVTILAGVLLLVHGWALHAGIQEVDRSHGSGLLILAAVWLSGMYCS